MLESNYNACYRAAFDAAHKERAQAFADAVRWIFNRNG